MRHPRLTAAAASLVLAAGLAFGTTAGASTHDVDQLSAVADPLLTVEAGGYLGKWAVDGATLSESFEHGGVVVSTGSTPLQAGLAADAVTSFGYVAGFDDFAQLSGQAGADVTVVRVVSASGVVTQAALADGIWAAVWVAGDSAVEFGPATIEFDTAAGTRTVSTDDVDAIAAQQRSAE